MEVARATDVGQIFQGVVVENIRCFSTRDYVQHPYKPVRNCYKEQSSHEGLQSFGEAIERDSIGKVLLKRYGMATQKIKIIHSTDFSCNFCVIAEDRPPLHRTQRVSLPNQSEDPNVRDSLHLG
jgi:hypothetical protein